MRITTRVHGYIDYGLATGLVVLAFALGIAGQPAGITLVAVGLALIVNAVLTDMEAGLKPALQMPVHLWIDGLLALLLGVSPWLLTFYDTAWTPHVFAAVAIGGAAFLTHTVPGYERRRQRASAPE